MRFVRALTSLLVGMVAVAGMVVVAPPAGADPAYRILIAGDSITQGSSGDYTWRYRLWNKLLDTTPGDVTFVGTRTDLYDNVGDTFGSQYYAIPFSATAHAARWGDSLSAELGTISSQVSSTGANVLVVMLGSNDLAFGGSPADAVTHLRSYIASAQAASPGIDVVLGEALSRYDGWSRTYPLTTETAEYATRLDALASELNTSAERVVVAGTRDGWDAKDHTWDGTHPNPSGETIIAQRISEALAELGIGTSSPNVVATTEWGVAGPSIDVTAGLEKATLHWSRNSTGATGMYIEVRRLESGQPWQRLPYAVGGTEWTAERLLADEPYEFRVVPAKGSSTGTAGPASVVTPVGPPPDPEPEPTPEPTPEPAPLPPKSRAPDVSAPQVGIYGVSAHVLSGPGRRVSYRFTGSDAEGPVTFAVSYRTHAGRRGFGAWIRPPEWSRLPAGSRSRVVAGGSPTCFRVRASDASGNTSPWSPSSCAASPLDDKALTRTGEVSRSKDRAAMGRSVSVLTKRGSSLVRRNQFLRGVYVIARRGPEEGSLRIFVGRKKIGSVKLRSSGRGYVRVLVRSRTARRGDIRVVSASKHAVHVDGIALLP